jgi:hypothetical protein
MTRWFSVASSIVVTLLTLAAFAMRFVIPGGEATGKLLTEISIPILCVLSAILLSRSGKSWALIWAGIMLVLGFAYPVILLAA